MLNRDDDQRQEDQRQYVDKIFLRGVDEVVPDKGNGDLDDGKPDDADDQVGVEEILHRVGAADGVDGKPGEAAEKINEGWQLIAEFAEPGGPLDHLREAVFHA